MGQSVFYDEDIFNTELKLGKKANFLYEIAFYLYVSI